MTNKENKQTITIKLTQAEKTIADRYKAESELKKLNAKAIFKLCESGKKGQQSLIKIAQYMKANGDDTATLKTQISRAMNKLKTGLSLQGIGKNDKVEQITIAPKQVARGGKAEKVEKVKAKALDTEVVWNFVVERFTRDELIALVEAYNDAHKTKLKIA